MSTHLASAKVGHSTVRVTGEGCHGCGTLYSASWHRAKILQIAIGLRQFHVDLYRCEECEAKESRPGVLGPPREGAQGHEERQGKPTLPDGAAGVQSGRVIEPDGVGGWKHREGE